LGNNILDSVDGLSDHLAMVDASQITQDDFDKWIRPNAALAALRALSGHVAMKAILHRIAASEILSVARKSVIAREFSEETYRLWNVPIALWASSDADDPLNHFWRTVIFL
jgi:hypothetical protein